MEGLCEVLGVKVSVRGGSAEEKAGKLFIRGRMDEFVGMQG